MFVLPPPPRYATQAAFHAAIAAGHVSPMLETNNVLSHPEDQFLVGEGTYELKEDLHLATPPPHPSDPPVVNPNPLVTTPPPATAGTRLSLIALDVRTPSAAFHRLMSSFALSPSIAEHPGENQSYIEAKTSSDGEGRGTSTSDGGPSTAATATSAPAFGESNAMIVSEKTKEGSKRKKPKNNMSKSNSSFISRVIINDNLSKRLAERPSDGIFAFANVNRAVQWLDLSSNNKADYLTKILFAKAHCLSHDVNPVTKGSGHIDVILGFSTGEVLWWEPNSQRYSRLNKNGVIIKSPVTQIRWIPGSENLFMASHNDGSIVVYDKEREDSAFQYEEDPSSASDERNTHTTAKSKKRWMQVFKSVHSKSQKTNPVAFWKFSNHRINEFAFSPDNRHLAVASENGTLRIIDYLNEQTIHVFYSYYGGLSCVCWSPDGKYVLSGGQDDLISIWCPCEGTLIARCQGHESWVTSVSFDPWRCDEKNYRFGSVGEDCRLCLWDFNVGMLHRPKAASIRHRTSIASRVTAPQRQDDRGASPSQTQSHSTVVPDSANEDGPTVHPVEPRSTCSVLPPVLSKQADSDPLTWLMFTEDAILTSSTTGHIRRWNRPSDPPSRPESRQVGVI